VRIYDQRMKVRPMLQVRDVAASSQWYQAAVGLRSGHGGDEFEMLFAGDEFVLQLHRLDAHEHGILTPGARTALGAGVSLWFEADDRVAFDAMVERAHAAGAEVVEEPHWNPLAHHTEATLVDPDGYIVVINTPMGAEG
jgi:catechol 2,3-dioxygenase-like lactoylglutathione lyase family enzyme